MKVKLTITHAHEFEVRYLKVEAGVRYWEDSVVNGEEDGDGRLVPFRDGHLWTPLIDVEDGRIVDWPEGTTAQIHYKVCDAGTYKLLDPDRNIITEKDGYVPSIMCPKENGFGDYIIMDIDEKGMIIDWSPDFEAFNNL